MKTLDEKETYRKKWKEDGYNTRFTNNNVSLSNKQSKLKIETATYESEIQAKFKLEGNVPNHEIIYSVIEYYEKLAASQEKKFQFRTKEAFRFEHPNYYEVDSWHTKKVTFAIEEIEELLYSLYDVCREEIKKDSLFDFTFLKNTLEFSMKVYKTGKEANFHIRKNNQNFKVIEGGRFIRQPVEIEFNTRNEVVDYFRNFLKNTYLKNRLDDVFEQNAYYTNKFFQKFYLGQEVPSKVISYLKQKNKMEEVELYFKTLYPEHITIIKTNASDYIYLMQLMDIWVAIGGQKVELFEKDNFEPALQVFKEYIFESSITQKTEKIINKFKIKK